MKAKLAKYWPTILHVTAGLLYFLDPSVKHYASGHPGETGLLFLWAEAMRWAQSPRG